MQDGVPAEKKSEGRNFGSLTYTLVLSFLFLSLMTVLIVSSLEIYFSFQKQHQNIASQQSLIAQNAAYDVKSFIAGDFDSLETAAGVSSIYEIGTSEQEDVLNRMLGSEPSIRQLILLDADGQKLAEVSRLSRESLGKLGRMLGDDPFSRTKIGERYMSSVYIDNMTSEPLVLIAVPVENVFGDFEGTLIAEVNLKFMWDLVDSIKIGDSGFAYVVDREGDLIAFGDIGRVLKGDNMGYLKEVKDFMSEGASGHEPEAEITTGIDGNQVVTSHVDLGEPDWAVVIEMPVTEAYSSVMNEIFLIAVAAAFSLLAAVSGSVYLSRRITKPIKTLRDAVVDIGSGKLGTKIEIASKNEIGDLASSFNKMASDLRLSHDELRQHASELERNVRERTLDLDQKVSELTETKTAVLNMMDDMDSTNRELVETKEELENSFKKLSEVDAKKDQFISIAAHELKTPLTSIHGFSQLLHNDAIVADSEKRKKYLGIIDSESKRLANLVNEILDLSRIDLGTIKFVFDNVDVNEIMESVKSEMDVPVGEHGLKSEYHVEKNLPKIFTDRERLTQVLINLINNSVKYTPKGKITVTVKKTGRYIQFSVSDTGIGIAKENMEKVFERFYQVDSSYTRKAGGTGLGLSLCKEFIEMLGGRIWVESVLGRGSTFNFALPVKTPPDIVAKALKDEDKKGTNPGAIPPKASKPALQKSGHADEKAAPPVTPDVEKPGEEAAKPAAEPKADTKKGAAKPAGKKAGTSRTRSA